MDEAEQKSLEYERHQEGSHPIHAVLMERERKT